MLITGTPVQNNLVQLLSLLIFINPELFEPAKQSFESIFTDDLQDLMASKRIERATSILSPFVMRRKKIDVRNDIPIKQQFIEYCQMDARQKQIYHNILIRSKKEQEKLMTNAEPVKKKKKTDKVDKLENILMHLRKVTNHSLLQNFIYTDRLETIGKELHKELEFLDSRLDYIIEDLSIMSDFQIHSLCSKYKVSKN
jgi:SWI/SNF-related matrix-associated actin-dependent regulator 1 of chromatin subfamily A